MFYWKWQLSYKQLVNVLAESGVFGQNISINYARQWYLKSFDYKPELCFYKDYYLYDLTSVKVGHDVIKEVKAVYSFRSISEK